MIGQIPPFVQSIVKSEMHHQPTTLAGGALRDLDNGRPVKDWDIFLGVCNESGPSGDTWFVEAVTRIIATHAAKVLPQPPAALSAARYRAMGALLLGVTDLEIQGEYVNLVGFDIDLLHPNGRHWNRVVIETFDLGICQIATDFHQMDVTDDYNNDKANEIMTFTHDAVNGNTSLGVKRAMRHWKRIHPKYPDWPFVSHVPPSDL
jgi:hypothetical protein